MPTSSDTQVIPPAEAVYESLTFSPDGNYIYFLKAENAAETISNLYRTPVLGGTPQVVVRDVDADITFSPDGKRFAYIRENAVKVGGHQLLSANADETDEKVIVKSPSYALNRPAWSPDGKQIATFEYLGDRTGITALDLMDLASGKNRRLAAFAHMLVRALVWMPDGRGLVIIYQGTNAGLPRREIGFVSSPAGQFHAITKDMSSYQTLTLSPDGKTLVTVQEKSNRTLYLLPAAGFAGSSPNPALPQNKDLSDFALAGNGDLYIDEARSLARTSADGTNKKLLLDDPVAVIIRPTVCTGGRYVVMAWGGHGHHQNVWRVDADGSNLRQLTDEEKAFSYPACSPDGKWVYFQELSGEMQIKRVPIDGGTSEAVPQAVVPETFLDAGFSFSSDGKLLALGVTSLKTNRTQIVLVNPDSGAPESAKLFLDPDPRITGSPKFSPDGKAVVYPIRQKGTDNLWLQPLDGTRGHQVTNFSSDTIRRFQFSPDGKTLGVLQEHTESDVVLLRDSEPSAN